MWILIGHTLTAKSDDPSVHILIGLIRKSLKITLTNSHKKKRIFEKDFGGIHAFL